jgi:phosphate transport system substrate-binding protein
VVSHASRSFALSSLIGLAATVLLFGLLYLSHTPTGATGSVQIVGSESMRSVVSACAEAFMSRNPKVDIIVKGGGSADGVAAVLHGIADVGMVSRELSQRERDFAASKGIELSEIPLARDGVTVVVNRANRIASLSLEQLQAIFAGTVRNWRDLGGEDEEIVAIGRATGSGTQALFAERVFDGRAHAASVLAMSSNEAVVAEVAARAGAVGYAGLGALQTARGVKLLALSIDGKSAPAAADADAIRTGSYPLSRTLVLVAPRRTTALAKAFVDDCTGNGGRDLLRRAGYISMVEGSR